MTQIVLNTNGVLGGVIQGEFGTYQANSNGSVTVDARDAPPLLAAGMSYTKLMTDNAIFANAVTIATVGQIVASAALSNGALTIANQPDVPRQVNIRVDPGTLAITAGNLNITYNGNDGQSHTEAYSLVTAASTLLTVPISKGVAHLSTPTITALAGGASPHIQLDTTATISLPVGPNSTSFTVLKENVSGADEAVGTASTVTLGSSAPTSAPNSTRTYSFLYSYVA